MQTRTNTDMCQLGTKRTSRTETKGSMGALYSFLWRHIALYVCVYGDSRGQMKLVGISVVRAVDMRLHVYERAFDLFVVRCTVEEGFPSRPVQICSSYRSRNRRDI